MLAKFFFFAFIVIFTFVYFSSLLLTQHSFSQSPSVFVHWTTDPVDDFVEDLDALNISSTLPMNITSFTITSDGYTLNVTLWLDKPFSDKNFEYYKKSNLTYTMRIFTHDPITLSGYVTNVVAIFPNKSGWTQRVVEIGPSYDINKTISETNHTDFYENGKNYVTMTVDLASLGYPSNYKLNVASSAIENNESIADRTLSAIVPRTSNDYFFRLAKSPMVVYPNEETKFLLHVDAIGLNNRENMTLVDLNDNDTISLSFIPEVMDTPLNGTMVFQGTLLYKGGLNPGVHELKFYKITYTDYGNLDNKTESIRLLLMDDRPWTESVPRFLTSIYAYIWVPFVATSIIVLILHKKFRFDHLLNDIKASTILGFNSAIIAGVLVFLSIGGDSNYLGGLISQSGFLTASIVVPFSLSAVTVMLTGKVNTGLKFALIGFIYLIFSVVLVSFAPPTRL